MPRKKSSRTSRSIGSNSAALSQLVMVVDILDASGRLPAMPQQLRSEYEPLPLICIKRFAQIRQHSGYSNASDGQVGYRLGCRRDTRLPVRSRAFRRHYALSRRLRLARREQRRRHGVLRKRLQDLAVSAGGLVEFAALEMA